MHKGFCLLLILSAFFFIMQQIIKISNLKNMFLHVEYNLPHSINNKVFSVLGNILSCFRMIFLVISSMIFWTTLDPFFWSFLQTFSEILTPAFSVIDFVSNGIVLIIDKKLGLKGQIISEGNLSVFKSPKKNKAPYNIN